MIIDKNSDSSVDLVDWLRRSSDESDQLARTNMLYGASIDDVYKLTGEKKVLDILYDESTGRLTIVYKDGSTVSIYLDPNGGGCDCDLSEYAKLTDLEAEVNELESKIPTSTSKLTNDSDFVNSTQVDDRIKEVVGAAPEALDTLHEISKALGDDPDFAATITNQIADVKKSIPSIEGLASEIFVKDQINAIPKTDLTGYAKEEWVKSQGYLTEHQDISNLATKAEVEEVKNSIPSIEGLATEAYVGQAKSDIEKWVAEQGYLTEHQDISHLASKDYVNEQISKIEHPAVDLTEYAKTSEVSEAIAKSETDTKAWVGEQNYLTEHQDISHLATKDEIPSLEGLATEKYVDDKIASIEHPSIDLSNLATKDEVSAVEAKIPSIEGLATQTWVEQKIAEAELNDPDIDTSVLATKSELAEVEAKIPSIDGLASQSYVDEQIAKIEHPTVDLTEYAKTSEVTESITKSETEVKTWVEDQKYLKDHQDISHLATKEEVEEVKNSIPSIEGLATEDFVNEKIDSIQHPTVDLTGYAKEEWVEGKGYLTEHQDISHLATKEEIPSIEGLATMQYVENKADEVEAKIPNLDPYATRAWVEEAIAGMESGDIDHSIYALKSDLDGLASESFVRSEIAAIEPTDLSGLATKDELASAVKDLASQSYVDEKIEAIEHPTVDLSAYATKDELNSKIATLNSNFQWKDTVVTYEDIAKVYPDPQEGFSVYVDDERTTYVYMGGEWVAAASADDSEPIATEELDGLMPAEAMRKLNSLENYDDSSIKGDMTTLEAKLSFIEAKIAELSKTNIEVVAPSTSGTSLSDASKDYTIQGDITAKMTVANSKSVTISDSVISNDARASIKSTGDVELKNVSTEGTFAKANGNTVLNITEARSVTIKDMTVSSTQYNSMEIGLIGSVLPKSVIIDNCNFGGETSNNVISIHGTADEAIINISNCKFSKSSNPLRLSNRTGAKVTVNITNCSCEEWDARPEWAGFIICQDYTSKSIEEAKQANLFGSDKVTINFINFTLPGGKKLTKPEDMSEICGSGNNQILYVYRDAEYAADKANYKFTSYGDAYPQINII